MQMEFFIKFKTTNPKVIIAQRSFDGLRPFYVKLMWERNTYCCIYHVELDELQIGLNKMRIDTTCLYIKKVFVCKCTSIFLHFHLSMCGAIDKVCAGLIELWESIVWAKFEIE